MHAYFNIGLYSAAAGMLLFLPAAGVVLYGGDISHFLEFPPLTRYVAHAPFSIPIFLAIAFADILLVAGAGYLMWQGLRDRKTATPRRAGNFPWWGWAGFFLLVFGWIMAWTRFSWFQLFQQQTFTLPWLGYILVVNALCIKRSAVSPLTDRPGRFLLLFPASAVFWWFFEYLNRFVQNWYYLGIDDFSKLEYAFFATISFATVLHAVMSTCALFLTFPVFKGLSISVSLQIKQPFRWAFFVFILSCAGLFLMGIYPDYLFPLLWISPLLLLTSLQTLSGKDNIFSSVKNGDWSHVVVSAAAALFCGFLWEMWNIYSLAKWEYAVPFVNRFHIFEMPVLGYGGYLPFGLECFLIGGWLCRPNFWEAQPGDDG